MFTWLNPTVWLAGLLIGAAAFGSGFWKGNGHGHAMERADWITAQAEAAKLARKAADRRQDQVDLALANGAARAAGLRADADHARAAAGGVRDTLDSVERAATASNDAAISAVGALRVVVGQCVDEYRAVAEDADRSRSYAQTLMDGWTK